MFQFNRRKTQNWPLVSMDSNIESNLDKKNKEKKFRQEARQVMKNQSRDVEEILRKEEKLEHLSKKLII